MDNLFIKETLETLKESNDKIGQALKEIRHKTKEQTPIRGKRREQVKIEDYSGITDEQMDKAMKELENQGLLVNEVEEFDATNWLIKGEKSKQFIQQLTEKLQKIEKEHENEIKEIVREAYMLDNKEKSKNYRATTPTDIIINGNKVLNDGSCELRIDKENHKVNIIMDDEKLNDLLSKSKNEKDNKNNGGDNMKQTEIKNKEDLQKSIVGEIDTIEIYIDENGKVLSSELTSEQLKNAKDRFKIRPKLRLHGETMNSTQITEVPIDQLFFAKVKPNAIVPTKREEDAGFDCYTCETETIVIEPCSVRMIDTGIAIACNKAYFPKFFDKGGMGSKGIIVGAGVGDSGYRDSYFIPLINTNKNKTVVITTQSKEEINKCNYFNLDKKQFEYIDVALDRHFSTIKATKENKIIKKEDCIIKPINKAIVQFVMIPVPQFKQKEISWEELKNISSERGLGKLGSSGK